MKRLFVLLLLVSIVFTVTQSEAQISRKSQIEIFGGVAIPLAPDSFKDSFKVGTSIHGQYVMFPSPRFGMIFGVAVEPFSFDGDALIEDMGAGGLGIEVDGKATLVELAIGIRPYLSSIEASTQVFLLAMATYNTINTEFTVSAPSINFEESGKDKGNYFGVALGAGFEIPAGDRFNIIIQGLYRSVFVSEGDDVDDTGMIGDETISFVGVTVGLVF